MKRIVILISGRGSNMRALFEAKLPGKIVAVISNNPTAAGLDYARQQDIETRVINHRDFADRSAFDTALANEVDSFAPDLVVLAGFMRILTEAFVLRFAGRILNIHPSLLPAFPIIQAAVAVLPDDDEATLASRVLEQEHHIFPLAVRWFLDDRISLHDGQVQIDSTLHFPDAVISPNHLSPDDQS
jgi:phosphoribosylglycinamide formyltransferase-1